MNRAALPILFTSAGRRVELTRCFRAAAERLGARAEVHACDIDPELSAACNDADARFAVPRCSVSGYVDALIDYCRIHGIRLLVPTIDPELHLLALARERFAKVGTLVHVSAPETIEIVRDKAVTAEVLGKAGIPVPRTGTVEEVRSAPETWQWPVFVKPSGGSASRGIALAERPDQIRPTYDEPMIAQELLRGDEYTVNIYIDASGVLRAAIPHRRISVRAGEVEKGRTVRREDIRAIAGKVAAALPGASGVLCFQLIDDPQRGPRVFEINARFGGGYPLADHAGGRFAESLLARIMGRYECASDDWREGVTMMRYDAAVFDG